ncbi:MAG: WYL domain-containing protein [Ruminococcus sp.]|nr:WYL domain-containing protein [Ruminococcus sp.]
MELINEYKNRYVLALSAVLNRLSNGKTLSKSEIYAEIQEAAGVEKHAAFGADFLEHIRSDTGLLFDFSDNTRVQPVRNGKIQFPISRGEKLYLLMILNSKYIPLFLDQSEIESLRHALEKEKLPDMSRYISVCPMRKGDDITPEFIQKFRLVQKAIRENRYIRYDNQTRQGLLKGMLSRPLRIEFSAADQVFRISMWNPAEGRAVKANLRRMRNVQAAETDTVQPVESIHKILSSRQASEPICLRIRNRRNAPERAALLFSMYDTTMKPLENGDWLMQLRYYEFDKQEIFRHILSFGPSAEVLSPAELIEEVQTHLKQYQHFSVPQGYEKG